MVVPSAGFSANDTRGRIPLVVSFTDASANSPTGWSWFFGDEMYNAHWTLMNASAAWSARRYFSSIATPDGTIVLMGGSASDGVKNDVWWSADNGATWVCMNANASWSKRYGHTSVFLPDGSIVLMGGWDGVGNYPLNDVWRSTDRGITWTEQENAADWSTRYLHASVALPDGSIVLMGGTAGSSAKNDVWRSTDKGISWILQTGAAPWATRREHTGVVLQDGSIILLGGYDNGQRHDVWRSENKGVNWTQQNSSVWPDDADGKAAVAMPDGSIVVTGGNYGMGLFGYTDSWRSTDNGSTWTFLNEYPGWEGRFYHSMVVLPDSSILLMGGDHGGIYGATPRNDVWRLQPAGSTARNPEHTYVTNGNFSVLLQVYNSAGFNSTRKADFIRVSPDIPFPNFTANRRFGIAPLKVAFTDSSENARIWIWKFGDGATSTARNPVHTYAKPGTYSVNLTVSNGTKTDWLLRTRYIIATGQNTTEIGVFRNSTGSWYLDYNADGTADAQFSFGQSRDIPVAGNWDKDNNTEIGFFRPSSGNWYLDYNNDGTADRILKLGKSGDTPVAGDWDGDNTTEPGVFRNSTGYWYLNTDGTANISVKFGGAGDIPVAGRWMKNGRTGIGFFRPSTGYWYLDYNNDGFANKSFRFGQTGDIPVTGDWDHDGITEIGIRNATGYWHLDSNNDGTAETTVKFGGGKDVPVTGDWDDDGFTETGFFRPSNGRWYLDFENDGTANRIVQLGQGGDTPVTGHWI